MKIKYIVFLILFFATGTTYAQTWNPINGKTSFNDSVRYLKYRHSGNLDSTLTISPTTGNLMFVARSAGGGGFGVDSITITPQGMLCAWASGLSTCYPLGAYYDSSALNSDSSYTYHYSRGVFVDSTYLPKSPIFGGTNLVIRDTTVTVNGNPVRGYIFDASGSGGGGSGSGKVYAGLYLLNVNDSTLKVDSSQVAIKDGFFNPGVIPYSNPLGILTQDYGGLGYDGLNAVIGHNDPSTLTGIRLNGDRVKMQAYLYGLRIQLGITGDTDPTKEYNIFNANHPVPYQRMYSDLNGYYRQHTVFNTDMQVVGLSTDSTAPTTTGTVRMLTTDALGKFSWQAIPTPGSSVSITPGLGLSASPNPITGSGSVALDTANAVVLSRQRALATYQTLIAFPNTTTRYMTGYNTFGSLYDSARQAISVAGTGLSYNATTGVITGSGGGVAHDSTWINARFGYAPNAIGLLYNTRWNTGSMPTGWAVNGSFSSLTTSFTGSKLTVTGGNYWGTAILADAANASAIQFATKRMPYERIDYSMDIVPTTKSAGALVYLAHARNGLLYSANETIAWDLSSGAQSGRVGIGADTSITFLSSVDSTSKMVFSVNDSLTLYYHKDGWSVTAGIINRTTGKITKTTFNQIWSGSGGLVNLGFIKGTYVVTNTNFSTSEEKGKVWIIGDSHESGTGASQQSKRWADVLFGSNQKYYGVWGLPSLSAKYFVSSGLLAELLADAQPSKFINSFSGYNDESEGFGAPATKTAVDSIIYPAVRALGAANVFMTGVPPRTLTTDLYNDSSYSVSVSRGIRWADFRKVLINGTTKQYPPYVYDGVHFNDSGHIKMAQEVTANFGYYILAAAASDSLDVLKFRGLRTAKGTRTAQLVGVESDGTAVTIPNDLPTGATYILNQYNTNPNLVVSQPNAYSQPGRIQISSVVGSDSALMVSNPTTDLLRIGFNGGSVLNVGNVDVSNGGLTGFQQYNSFIGGAAGNLVMSAASANRTKALIAGGTFNGAKNNVLINSYNGSTMTGNLGNIGIGSNAFLITSGQVNIGIGLNALSGVTSTNQNLEILTSATANGLGTTSRANTIILGSTDSEVDNYVSNDVVLRPANGLTAVKMWVGGRTATTPVSINAPAGIGTNQPGMDFTFATGRSTGVGYPGRAIFDFSDINVASASSINSTYKRTMQVERLGVAIGSGTTLTKAPDAALDVISTTQVSIPPRMPNAQRDLIQQGLLTLTNSAIGSGYTNATVLLTFTGGTCSTTPVAYVTIAGGVVQPSTIVITNRGACSAAPTISLTSGAGTGATFTATYGATAGGQIFNTTSNSINTWNGVNWTGDYITSSAGTLTLTHGTDYNFTGTTSTWTLPAVNAALLGRGNMITIKNLGSGAITLNSNAGNTIYTTVAVGALTINAGDAVTLMPNGTYFLVE